MIAMRFEGGEQLARAFDSLGRRPQRATLVKVLSAGATPIQKMASSIAPVDPGAPDLALNIVVSAARSEDMGAVAIGPALAFFYGLFQEFGTVHHSSQPFLRPAFDAQVQAALAIINASMWVEVILRGLASARTGAGGGFGDTFAAPTVPVMGGAGGSIL